MVATYGKANTTLRPEYFFRTSVIYHFPPSTCGLGRNMLNDLGPKEIFYRPRAVLYNTEKYTRDVRNFGAIR